MTIDPFLLGATVLRCVPAPSTSPVLSLDASPLPPGQPDGGAGETPSPSEPSLAPTRRPPRPPPKPAGTGASEDFSRSVQLALLSLLKGGAAESCIAGLRLLGAMGPSEADYLALERDGLAVKGAATGHRILTPRGRAVAGNVAIEVAHKVGAHRAVYGIDRAAGTVYFRCSCGAHEVLPFSPAAQTRVLGQLVRTAPMAGASIEDAKALISERVQAFIRATQGGGA